MRDGDSPQARKRLRGYEEQLLAARRLARFRAQRRAAENQADPTEAERRLQEYITQVAHEMYSRLMYTGSENPEAETIRRTMGETLGQEVEFVYPPGRELHLVLHDGEKTYMEPSTAYTRQALWRATLQVVENGVRRSGEAGPPPQKDAGSHASDSDSGEFFPDILA